MFKSLSASLVALSLVAVAQPASAETNPFKIKKPIKTLPVITPRPIYPTKVLTAEEKAKAEAAAKAAAEAAAKAAAGN
jgi:hypothetical protein